MLARFATRTWQARLIEWWQMHAALVGGVAAYIAAAIIAFSIGWWMGRNA